MNREPRTVQIIRGGGKPLISKKVGRNDLCPCGSGKKSKNCCKGKTEYFTKK